MNDVALEHPHIIDGRRFAHSVVAFALGCGIDMVKNALIIRDMADDGPPRWVVAIGDRASLIRTFGVTTMPSDHAAVFLHATRLGLPGFLVLSFFTAEPERPATVNARGGDA